MISQSRKLCKVSNNLSHSEIYARLHLENCKHSKIEMYGVAHKYQGVAFSMITILVILTLNCELNYQL